MTDTPPSTSLTAATSGVLAPAAPARGADRAPRTFWRDTFGSLKRQKGVMVGLVLDDKGVLRHGQPVLTANGAGEILSGSFAPTLNKAVAFARIPAGEPGDVRVDIRGREVPVRVVKYPFVRDGKPCEGI